MRQRVGRKAPAAGTSRAAPRGDCNCKLPETLEVIWVRVGPVLYPQIQPEWALFLVACSPGYFFRSDCDDWP